MKYIIEKKRSQITGMVELEVRTDFQNKFMNDLRVKFARKPSTYTDAKVAGDVLKAISIIEKILDEVKSAISYQDTIMEIIDGEMIITAITCHEGILTDEGPES